MTELIKNTGKVQKIAMAALAALLLVGAVSVNGVNTKVRAVEPVTPPSKPFDVCKNGGWSNFTTSPGPFKNQGQCVSHFAKSQHSVSPTPAE